jgi:hypothetical protein
MKKVIIALGLFFALGTAAQAQCTGGSASADNAPKACCAGKAAKAASTDTTIEKRVSDDGIVSYVRKESDTQGNVKFVSVRYDEGSNTFVNVAPKTLSADSKTGMVKKSTTATKACANEGGEKKACCKAEATAAPANQ